MKEGGAVPKSVKRKHPETHASSLGMDSCQAGEWVQSEVETYLLRHRQVVAPVKNASAPYDLVWDRGEERLRIQVKKGRVRDGVIYFTVNPRPRNAKGIKVKSYVGKIDAFMVFVPEISKFYIVPIADAPHGATHMQLRLAPRRNRGGNKSTWATDYEMRFTTAQIPSRTAAERRAA
jgi:hypothetical protein